MRELIIHEYRHQYDAEADAAEREATDIICEPGSSLAIQDAPDADLNKLLERFGIKDGSTLPASLGITDPRYYGDFSNDPPDLRSALDQMHHAVNEVELRFAELPAKIRSRFQNDPLALARFVSDPENRPEAETLGLFAKRAPDPISAPANTPPGTPPGGNEQTPTV